MRAIRSGIEGDEVTDSYGPKSNTPDTYSIMASRSRTIMMKQAGAGTTRAWASPYRSTSRARATRGSRAARRCGYASRRATMAVEHALAPFASLLLVMMSSRRLTGAPRPGAAARRLRRRHRATGDGRPRGRSRSRVDAVRQPPERAGRAYRAPGAGHRDRRGVCAAALMRRTANRRHARTASRPRGASSRRVACACAVRLLAPGTALGLNFKS